MIYNAHQLQVYFATSYRNTMLALSSLAAKLQAWLTSQQCLRRSAVTGQKRGFSVEKKETTKQSAYVLFSYNPSCTIQESTALTFKRYSTLNIAQPKTKKRQHFKFELRKKISMYQWIYVPLLTYASFG